MNKNIDFLCSTIMDVNTWQFDVESADRDLVSLCKVIIENDTPENRPNEYFIARDKCIAHLLAKNFVLAECDKDILQTLHDNVIYAEYIGNDRYNGYVLGQMLDADDFDINYVPGRDKIKDYLGIEHDNTVHVLTAETLQNMQEEERMTMFTRLMGEKPGADMHKTLNYLLNKG